MNAQLDASAAKRHSGAVNGANESRGAAMTTHDRSILVTGATGRQGGATARHLLTKGWRVRALARDPRKPAAQALQQAGAEVVQGDYDDRASLEAAMHGVYGVFSVQASVDEVRQGKQIGDVAKAASVQHFVYSSVQSAADLARVGGDANKWEIERYIQALGLPATIVRPCLFMDDLLGSRYGVPDGTFAIAFQPDVAIGLIAADDIGAFVALAFERPDAYLGKTIEIAGDALTPPQIAAAISRTIGRSIPYVQIPIETVQQQNVQVARAFDFLNQVGYTTDIAALRKQHPGLMDFETWLERTDKAQFAALFGAQPD
jgi:uncharacterized protein YbjT (DUF2867 family)